MSPSQGNTRLALLVGVVALLGVAGAVALPERQAAGRAATPVVDYAPSVARMRAEAGHAVFMPRGLRAGWRPIATEVSGGDGAPVQWRLGFLAPSGGYAAVDQSDEPAASYTKRLTSDGVPQGAQRVNGVSWARFYRESKGQRSLVRTAGPVTIVVSGTASYSELAGLATALRPA
ncbi:MAG: DUF4245 family protein [Streptosporangiales bacterium]|nr:DUF4245 family protein [Streptosporangiales bacterium]